MKKYNEFEKKYIGLSDIATLVMVGCDEEGLKTELLHYNCDGDYSAYIVERTEGEQVEIGSHYRKVSSFRSWLKIYDDISLGLEVHGKEINVYRAGEFGCIIEVVK